MTASNVVRDGLRAALPAAVFSGLPSTLYAWARSRDPLEATVAAGSILLPRESRRVRLLAAAAPVHIALSVAWSIVLAAVLPRRNPLVEGSIAGLALAGVDLGFIGQRYPRIRELDMAPQVADHVAFGIIVAVMLSSREVD